MSVGPWQLVILLLVVVLIFGTKKLRNAGGDLGAAIRSFRKGLQDGDEADKTPGLEVDDTVEKPEAEPAKTPRQPTDADR